MTLIPAPRPAVAALLTAGAALVTAGPAAAMSVRVPLVDRGQPGIKLQGGVDQFQGGVTVPARWASWSGQLSLRWGASDQLASGSAFRVTVGGTVLGTEALDGSAGSATFTIPRSKASGNAHTVPVTIEARLRTKSNPCPGPDDLGAYLQFSADSSLELDGAWSSSPLRLRSLPSAMVTGAGRDPSALLVRFTGAPTPDTLRAATVAVGEVADAAGGAGLDLRVSQPSVPLKPRDNEAVITIAPSAGKATLRVGASVRRPPRIWLTGDAPTLWRAAGGMRAHVARSLPGDSVTDLPAFVVRHRSVPRRIQLPSGRFNGFGSGQVTLGFELPVHRQALRGARLRLAADYDAPGGGRATVSVNGRMVTAESLRKSGASRFTVEEQLAGRGPALQRADLRAGANRVTVDADLGYPAARCNLPEEAGALSVSDFGSVTLVTRARPVERTLSTFPFPFNKTAGWGGTSVVLPAAPTDTEVAAVLTALGTARRVTGEVALPAFRVGGGVPRGNALVLARPGQVPKDLVKDVPGPVENGTLAASGSASSGVRIVAVGSRALAPFDGAYEIGTVTGRVATVTAEGNVITRVSDPQRVTGVERGATSWRWPLVVIIVAGVGLLLMGLRGAIRRVREHRE